MKYSSPKSEALLTTRPMPAAHQDPLRTTA